MPLDLRRVEKFASKLSIRSREGGRMPFLFREQQKKIMFNLQAHLDKKRRLFVIFLKARRVGVSTWASAIQLAHCCGRSDSHAGIIAQNKEVGKAIFTQMSGFGADIKKINPGIVAVNNRLFIPHQDGHESDIWYSTAATVHGARGLTFSSLHLTEAAFYPYEGAYTALLNTLSSDPDNVCIIETTANGMEGPGEAYFNYWNAAVEGDSEFLAQFLPWWEDPEYVRDPLEAEDAPRDEYERWLMNEVKNWETGKKVEIGKDRIAWFRLTMEDKCEGNLDRWRAEFPATPEEAFIATGNPAFTDEEQRLAIGYKTKPKYYGELTWNVDTKKPKFTPESHPREDALCIYEFPQPRAHYFFGVDSARGKMNVNPGDFAAIVGWNGETGEMAARYMSRVSPEELAYTAYLIGRYYNDAILNVEINNLGYVVMRELRDRYFYPTQHRWKGRDDKFDSKVGTALGFETTERYRKMMFNLFRTALYRKECIPRDEIFIEQMLKAKMEMEWRWEIAVGHDDVFMAGLLGWIAREHIHPKACATSATTKNVMLTAEELAAAQLALTGNSAGAEAALSYTVGPGVDANGAIMISGNDHLRMLQRYNKRKGEPSRLEGI